MISAAITVIRNDEELDIYVSGQTEYFGSPNPFERGVRLADWSVDEPKGFELTSQEIMMAEEALENVI